MCCLVLFVSTVAKRLAGKTTLTTYIFLVKGFPCKDQIEKLFAVNVSFCILPVHNIDLNFLIASYFFEGTISPILCCKWR